jgi:hypothetical protein
MVQIVGHLAAGEISRDDCLETSAVSDAEMAWLAAGVFRREEPGVEMKPAPGKSIPCSRLDLIRRAQGDHLIDRDAG